MSLSVKDKAEILQQVEELLNIKEELTKQVCALWFITLRVRNDFCSAVFVRVAHRMYIWRLLAELLWWVKKIFHVSFCFLCSGDIAACVIRTGEVKGEGIAVRTTETSSKYRIDLLISRPPHKCSKSASPCTFRTKTKYYFTETTIKATPSSEVSARVCLFLFIYFCSFLIGFL